MAADDEGPADVPHPDASVRRLAEAWEARARSAQRDFFVASHPGWDDSQAWQRQAQIDCQLFTHGLADTWLAGADVLEIGCGVGRLVPALLPRVRSYTGVDIAPSMVAEARRRCAATCAEDRVRFLVSDGLALPEALQCERFQLVLAVAVFIHCPLHVVRSLVIAAEQVLSPGGILRCQLRADATDASGYSGGGRLRRWRARRPAHQRMRTPSRSQGAPRRRNSWTRPTWVMPSGWTKRVRSSRSAAPTPRS